MAARSNIELLSQQIRDFKPDMVAISDLQKLSELKEAIANADPQTILLGGEAGVIEVARYSQADCLVIGILDCAGLLPTIAAIEAGKDIALANKETLIAGGSIILPLVKKHSINFYLHIRNILQFFNVCKEFLVGGYGL